MSTSRRPLRSLHFPLVALQFSLLATFAIGQAPSPPCEVRVGTQTILIPAPAGCERMDGINAGQDELAAQFIGSSNRRLILFGSPGAVAALRRGEAAVSPRNFNVQTLRSLEDRALTPAQFESLRAQSEDELDRLGQRLDAVLGRTMDKASKNLSEKLQENVEVKVGTPVPLGTFERTRDSLGFSMMFKTQFTVAGKDTAGLSVVATMIVRVRDRCLYLYATSDRNSEADELWVKEQVLKWRDAIFAANGQKDAPASSATSRILQQFDFQAILRSAMVGAGIGGVVGLLTWLIRRLKKTRTPTP